MKINKIIVRNFRQFQGTHELDFQVTENKNVVVVLGDNGSGKTTLSQAFLFCIYGLFKLDFPDYKGNERDKNNDKVIRKLCNDNAWNESSDFVLSVKILFEHNNIQYDVERNYKFWWGTGTQQYRMADEVFVGSFLDPKNPMGATSCDEQMLRKILPSSLSNVFFFDGERMKQLASDEAKDVLSESVINILGLSTFRNALRLLKRNNHAANASNISRTVENLIKKELIIENFSDSQITGQIEAAEQKYEEYKNLKKELETKGTQIKQTREEVLQKIKATSADKVKQEMRVKYLADNNQIRIQIKKKQKDIISKFSQNFTATLTQKYSDTVQNIISESIVNDRDIIGINAVAIDRLIARRKCLCDNDLIEGTDAYSKLIEWKDFLPPKDLSSLLTNVKQYINEQAENATAFKRDFSSLRTEIIEFEKQHEDNEIEIQKIIKDNLAVEESSKLEEELKNLVNWSSDNDREINKCNEDIKKISDEIESLNKKLREITVNNGKNNVTYKKINLLDEVYDIIEAQSSIKEKEAREFLQRNASSNYEKLLEKKYEIIMNDDYSYSVYDEKGTLKTPVLSEGERIVTSFAFIGALIIAAKMLNKTLQAYNIDDDMQDYPLVMDAPFAKVDNNHRKKVASLLPSFSSQVIIFSIDSQWYGAIEEELKDNIAKIYYLDYDKVSKSSHVKVGEL